jgi:hypothetical protein
MPSARNRCRSVFNGQRFRAFRAQSDEILPCQVNLVLALADSLILDSRISWSATDRPIWLNLDRSPAAYLDPQPAYREAAELKTVTSDRWSR